VRGGEKIRIEASDTSLILGGRKRTVSDSYNPSGEMEKRRGNRNKKRNGGEYFVSPTPEEEGKEDSQGCNGDPSQLGKKRGTNSR